MDKLLKLLKLTASSNDHEALSAMRKAQALMKKCGISWEDMLRKYSDKENAGDTVVTFVYDDIFDLSSFGSPRRKKPAYFGNVSTNMSREETLGLYDFLKQNINQVNLVDASWIQTVSQSVLFKRDGQNRLYAMYHKYF